MEEIGGVIKYYRGIAGLTQSQLAEDIISVSYLSKIENGLDQPSDEVLALLKKKLNIEDENIIGNEGFIQELKEWYKDITLKNNSKASSFLEKYKDYLESQTNIYISLYYQIFKAYYYLFQGDYAQAKKLLENVKPDNTKFTSEWDYYYLRIKGMYYVFKQEYSLALSKFQDAEEISAKLPTLENWERSEIYYMLGLMNSRVRYDSQAIFFTSKALELYKKNYNLQRLAECHLLLGIAYERTGFNKFALENLNNTIKISTAINNTLLLSKAHHNIAYLNVAQGDSELALKEFLKSYEYKMELDVPIQFLLSTNLCIVIELFRLTDYEDCRKWINKGLTSIKKLDINDGNRYNYYYHLTTILKYIDNAEDFEEFVSTKVIPHFRSKSQYEYVARYNHLLGRYFEGLKKYKKASSCLEESLNILNDYKNLGGVLL